MRINDGGGGSAVHVVSRLGYSPKAKRNNSCRYKISIFIRFAPTTRARLTTDLRYIAVQTQHRRRRRRRRVRGGWGTARGCRVLHPSSGVFFPRLLISHQRAEKTVWFFYCQSDNWCFDKIFPARLLHVI